MKKPKISLSKESIVDFFLNHGEKLVVGLFAALACTLVWGGIDAVRTKPVKPNQRPAVIVEQAAGTMKHIGESKGPPADTSKRPSLAKLVEPWKEKVVVAPPVATLLSAPLSDEKAKRTAPEILPLVDLHVRPGWAVIAVPQDAMSGMMAGIPDQSKEGREGDKDGGKKKGKKAADAGDYASASPGAPPGGPPGSRKGKFSGGMGGLPGMMGEGVRMTSMAPPVAPVMPGKIVPYCLVTALIPANSQQEAYTRAFAGSGLQTPADMPLWSDYRVERAEIGADTPADAQLKWTRIDLQKVAKSAEDWVGTQPEILPPDLQLDPSQLLPMDDNAQMAMPYLLPLPTLSGDPWGIESLHPWVAAQLRKRQAEMERFEALQREEMEQSSKTNILGGGRGGPGSMGTPGGMMGRPGGMMPPMGGPMGGSRGMMPPGGPMGGSRGMMPPGGPMGGRPGAPGQADSGDGSTEGSRMMPPGMNPGMNPDMMSGAMGGRMMGGMTGVGGEAMAQLPEYRMFRFVDTTVEPGKTYRYRVRISLRNPNYGLPAQYLADPELSKPAILPAKWSEPSELAHVPDKTGLLVRSLRKGEAKKSKTGYEVLVLAENPEGGNYMLRSLTTEVGALANFDKKLAKGPEAKTAENITTNSMLIDARGRQEEGDAKKGMSSDPTEPLELLFLREDGSFTVASAAESQRSVDRYAQTLPAADDGKKDKDGEGGGGSTLFGSGGGGLFGAPGGSPPAGPRGSRAPPADAGGR